MAKRLTKLKPPPTFKYVQTVRGKNRFYQYVRSSKKRYGKLSAPGTAAYHERYAELRIEIEAHKHAELERAEKGTIEWLVQAFVESPHYLNLPSQTQRAYRVELRRLRCLADFVCTKLRRKHIIELGKPLKTKPRRRKQFIQVMIELFEFGITALKLRMKNPANRALDEKLGRGRLQWTETHKHLFEVSGPPTCLRTAYMLAAHIGASRGAILQIKRCDYNGHTITLQVAGSKEKSLVPVPAQLKAYLDRLPPSLYFVEDDTGAQISPSQLSNKLRKHLNELANKTGDPSFKDLVLDGLSKQKPSTGVHKKTKRTYKRLLRSSLS